jgi:hypothetical protein
MRNICSIVIGVAGEANAARMPHPVGHAALPRYVSLLCAYGHTSAEGNHTSDLILQIFQQRKRV